MPTFKLMESDKKKRKASGRQLWQKEREESPLPFQSYYAGWNYFTSIF